MHHGAEVAYFCGQLHSQQKGSCTDLAYSEFQQAGGADSVDKDAFVVKLKEAGAVTPL